MKIKISEATKLQLNWLVATIQGLTPQRVLNKHGIQLKSGRVVCDYSTDWAQGGPIIEREKISPRLEREGLYFAPYFNGVAHVGHQSGPTPLIAAMRCYVVSKLGDEVEIPDEL